MVQRPTSRLPAALSTTRVASSTPAFAATVSNPTPPNTLKQSPSMSAKKLATNVSPAAPKPIPRARQLVGLRTLAVPRIQLE
ncbi:MAG: hypothetical protein Q9208_006911 [Pyrenodesmia sp. 3 TL-2023]